MNIFEVIASFGLLAACIILIVLVALQEGSEGKNAALTGGSDSYLSTFGKKGASEFKLTRLTQICAGVFFGLSMLVGLAGIFF